MSACCKVDTNVETGTLADHVVLGRSKDAVGGTALQPADATAGSRGAGRHFFSSIKVASLRIAGVSFSANFANSQGNVTSRRT